jgi:hypothetical protein
MNAHSVSDVRQLEIHTAEPLVPGPSTFEAQAVGEKLLCAIHKVINSVWNKEELPDQ